MLQRVDPTGADHLFRPVSGILLRKVIFNSLMINN